MGERSNAFATEALLALHGERGALRTTRFPHAAGLYAVYGDEDAWRDLHLDGRDTRPLYIGKAERSLHGRDLKTHFETGKTGWSTLRRTLAALLKYTPQLRNAAQPAKPTHYALIDEDDATLTAWMHEHMTIALWLKPAECDDLAAVEDAVIAELVPALNVKGNEKSMWRDQVKAARHAMADQLGPSKAS